MDHNLVIVTNFFILNAGPVMFTPFMHHIAPQNTFSIVDYYTGLSIIAPPFPCSAPPTPHTPRRALSLAPTVKYGSAILYRYKSFWKTLKQRNLF